MLCRVVVFDVPTSGFGSTTEVTTDAQGRTLPSKPARAAIVVGNGASHSVDPGGSPTGLGTDGVSGSIGFVCDKQGGQPQQCVSFLSQDNVSTSNSKRAHVDNVAAYIPDPTLAGGSGALDGIYGESIQVALNSSGSLSFSVLGLTGRGGRVVCQVFYGDDQFSAGDIKVDSGKATTPDGSTTIAQGIVNRYHPSGGLATAFKPTHVFLLCGNDAAWTDGFNLPFDNDFSDWEDGCNYSFGFAQRDQGQGDDVITQRSFLWADKDNLSTSASSAYINTANTMMQTMDPSTGALAGACKITGFTDTGFSVLLNHSVSAYKFAYLALDLGHSSSEIFTYNTQAGTGATNLQIPTQGGETDAGQRLNPDGVVLLQTQVNYGQEDAAQTAASSATSGVGLASRHVDEVSFLYASNNTTFYSAAAGAIAQYTIVASTDIFANYSFSTGDYLLVTGGDSGINAGRYEIASKASDSSIVLTANAASATGPTYGIDGTLYICGFGLSVPQRSATWQVKDNSSTTDTQSCVWDELGYLVKKHGTATSPTNTVTRFYWQDHGSASVATSEDAVFYYESSQLNNRSWPMLAFEFRRQRVTLASVELTLTAAVSYYVTESARGVEIKKTAYVSSAQFNASAPDPSSQSNFRVYPSPAEVPVVAPTVTFEADWEPVVAAVVVTATVPTPTGAYPQSRTAGSNAVACVASSPEVNFGINLTAAVAVIVAVPMPGSWSQQAGFQHQPSAAAVVPATLGLAAAGMTTGHPAAGNAINISATASSHNSPESSTVLSGATVAPE